MRAAAASGMCRKDAAVALGISDQLCKLMAERTGIFFRNGRFLHFSPEQLQQFRDAMAEGLSRPEIAQRLRWPESRAQACANQLQLTFADGRSRRNKALAERIRRLAGEGLTVTEVAERLAVSPGRVREVAKAQSITLVHGNVRRQVTHPPPRRKRRRVAAPRTVESTPEQRYWTGMKAAYRWGSGSL